MLLELSVDIDKKIDYGFSTFDQAEKLSHSVS
jgi:hypothetical protein